MKSAEILKFVASLIICQLAGIIGSFFTRPAISTWYQSLNKPSFTPPSSLFGPVWISLYLLMGIALFLVWRKSEVIQVKTALIVFFIQLFLNAFWSIAFFGFRSPAFGLIVILFLWISILLTIILFARLSLLASILLWPYFIWVSFASWLNFSLWWLNR